MVLYSLNLYKKHFSHLLREVLLLASSFRFHQDYSIMSGDDPTQQQPNPIIASYYLHRFGLTRFGSHNNIDLCDIKFSRDGFPHALKCRDLVRAFDTMSTDKKLQKMVIFDKCSDVFQDSLSEVRMKIVEWKPSVMITDPRPREGYTPQSYEGPDRQTLCGFFSAHKELPLKDMTQKVWVCILSLVEGYELFLWYLPAKWRNSDSVKYRLKNFDLNDVSQRLSGFIKVLSSISSINFFLTLFHSMTSLHRCHHCHRNNTSNIYKKESNN